MKLTKELLIENAFKIYLLKGYSQVSISVLQEELGIGRASLYYYFKDKDALFDAIIDKYYMQVIETSLDKLESCDELSIDLMIQNRVARFSEMCNHLINNEAGGVQVRSVNLLFFTSIALSVDRMLHFHKLRQRSIQLWKKAIQNDINKGEIREDINVESLAVMFSNIRDPFDADKTVSDVKDVRQSVPSYIQLYELLRK